MRAGVEGRGWRKERGGMGEGVRVSGDEEGRG